MSATKRIVNQGASNHMQYIENEAYKNKDIFTVYQDLQVVALREMFNDDERFIEHLASILNLQLEIKKEEK